MKLLLDECVPKRLARELTGHEVRHVTEVGLKGFKNGRLLAAIEKQYNALLTVDRNLSFQQDVSKFNIAVVVVHARSNRLAELQPLVPDIQMALSCCKPRHVTHVGRR